MSKSVFATNLCNLMKKRNLKPHQLGEAIGISRQTITQYMNDEVEPKMRAFRALAEYFEVSCDYLLGRSRTPAADDALQTIYKDIGLSDVALRNLKQNSILRELANNLLSSEDGFIDLKAIGLFSFVRSALPDCKLSNPESQLSQILIRLLGSD